MKLPFVALAVGAMLAAGSAVQAETAKRPNFLVIVADDLGFSDLGAFGGEIDTPNLDRLATGGVRFTGFHTAPTCSPTRSMLMSGTDNHRAGLGNMAEMLSPNQRGKPGHQGYLRPEVATLAEIFSANGYRTLYSGKWHLGLEPQQDPHARGFQHSFALLQGGHDHFGGAIANNPAMQASYTEDGKPVPVPAHFYSSDTFAAKLVDSIRQTKQGPDGQKPFFAYLAFTAPHWPLQAPADSIAKYKGRYDAGYDAIRAARLRRQAELGLYDPETEAHARSRGRPWAELSADEKAAASRDMEIYAAMVDRLDKGVGRVLEALRATGELDNTVILFLSDNGAEAMDIAGTKTAGIGAIAKGADNRPDNIGGPGSFVSYGPGWAQAGVGQSWLFKAYATEGGTRTVAFLNGGPLGLKPHVGRAFLSVADVVPTFLDYAGIPDHKGRFEGRAVEPIRGKSWKPWLSGAQTAVYGPDEAYGTELFGSRSLRRGDWKITDIGDGVWHIFNIARDPGETTDLAQQEPQRLRSLGAAWDSYAKDVGVILPDVRTYQP